MMQPDSINSESVKTLTLEGWTLITKLGICYSSNLQYFGGREHRLSHLLNCSLLMPRKICCLLLFIIKLLKFEL